MLLIAALASSSASAAKSPSITIAHVRTPHLSSVLPSGCPWVEQSRHHSLSPVDLAGEVLSRMTLREKADFVALATYPPLENANIGIPSLCIPALTLTDGPNGVGDGLTGVTQLPAAIGVAASFNPAIAHAIGVVEGQEARGKGIAVVQGPDLNLARVPQGGRIFETYGEDPVLAGVLGVADVKGIQSTGDLADVKHFTAYTQETARLKLNQNVSLRALAELYNAPFRAAVQQGDAASIMCSYGSLNGVNTCSDPYIYSTLHSWGFTGFVRSDLRAVFNVPQSLRAGISLVKPASATALVKMVQRHRLHVADLNHAVRAVLATMFKFGLIAHPIRLALYANVASAAHALVALRAAESSVVLLKDSHSVLPLAHNTRSIAVIGVDAAQTPQTSGGGSSAVIAPFIVTPLHAIRNAMGPHTRVTYQPGGPPTLDIDQLNNVAIVHGTPLKLMTPFKRVRVPGKSDLGIELNSKVTPAIATASKPGTGDAWAQWSLRVRPRRSGDYEVSIRQTGDTWLYLNHRTVVASMGLHAPADMTATVHLDKHRNYIFSATWFQPRHHALPKFGITDVTPAINAAVASARKAKIAIVFVGDFSTEGADSPNLLLSGDANALISAVAAVNPRTIVVLNTGNAVLMPWLSHVAGVLEAWYPGEQDGTAIAAILSGRVDPSGRLPLSFPSSLSHQPVAIPRQFPGVNLSVDFSSNLAIGYRWYQVHHEAPLFPFGFGLDYTKFKLSSASLSHRGKLVLVHVRVHNIGARTGADVIQAYVRYPNLAGEPPEQLRAFARVTLAPSASKTVTLSLAPAAFQIFSKGSFTTVAGQYSIDVGQSSSDLPLHLTLSIH
ncbi:MAG: beta-glucosidase family protein [Acidimicrobiales bacterium]